MWDFFFKTTILFVFYDHQDFNFLSKDFGCQVGMFTLSGWVYKYLQVDQKSIFGDELHIHVIYVVFDLFLNGVPNVPGKND